MGDKHGTAFFSGPNRVRCLPLRSTAIHLRLEAALLSRFAVNEISAVRRKILAIDKVVVVNTRHVHGVATSLHVSM